MTTIENAMSSEAFAKGQKWATATGLDDLAALTQGQRIKLRGNSPSGFRRLRMYGEMRFVGLNSRNRKYPLLYLDVAQGEVFKTDLEAFIGPDVEEE